MNVLIGSNAPEKKKGGCFFFRLKLCGIDVPPFFYGFPKGISFFFDRLDKRPMDGWKIACLHQSYPGAWTIFGNL